MPRVIEAFLVSDASAKKKRRLFHKLHGHFGVLRILESSKNNTPGDADVTEEASVLGNSCSVVHNTDKASVSTHGDYRGG